SAGGPCALLRSLGRGNGARDPNDERLRVRPTPRLDLGFRSGLVRHAPARDDAPLRLQNARRARRSRFLAGIVLTTVAVRIAFVPASSALRPARFEWGYGLYGSGVIAVLTLAAAFVFGGRIDDVPTQQSRRGDETLH